jgi:hypothetical protein
VLVVQACSRAGEQCLSALTADAAS